MTGSTRRIPSALVLVLAAAAIGCSAPSAEATNSTTSDLVEHHDQTGIDVQVLQVWTPARIFPNVQPWQGATPRDAKISATDPSVCPTLSTNAWGTYEERRVDCAAAFAKAVPFDVTGAAGPVMTRVEFTVEKRISDGWTSVDPDFCNFVELRLVARDAAVAAPSFAGVGFWTSRGETFTKKADLQAVGHTRLAKGDDATVYRFTGVSTCISSAHNSTSGNAYQTFSFKPYAAYDVPQDNGDVQRYRVWERIDGNHAVGRSWPGATPRVDATGFDRQDELLAH